MRKIIFIFSSFLFIQCSVNRTIIPITKTENITLEEFQKLDNANKLFIASDDEPGEKLMLCLTFIDKASKKALSNQRVSFYHASTDGEYEPSNPNDETTARLSGTTKTDKTGKIFVKTILPGDYGSTENNRHIHTAVYGAHPEPYDIFFNQYARGMAKFMDSGNEQMFFTDVKKTTDNILVCFITLEVKNPKAKD